MAAFNTSWYSTFEPNAHVRRTFELVTLDEPCYGLDHTLARDYCASAQRLVPICRNSVELGWLAKIREVAALAASDPAKGEAHGNWDHAGLAHMHCRVFAVHNSERQTVYLEK